ncbi:MAG: PfkB family carbohydrate kinase [Lacisediminihabitans sp.]
MPETGTPLVRGMLRGPEPVREQHRVAVIGDALIDEIRDNGASQDFVGGAGLNVAVGLSRLGVDTALLAMVGDDADGENIRATLARYRVRLLASPSRFGTSRAVSSRVAGEPVYQFNEAARRRKLSFTDRERAAIAQAAFVVVSCFPFDDQAQVDDLADTVSASGTRLIIDSNPRRGTLTDRAVFARNLERLGAISLLVKISDDDARLLYDEPIESSSSRMLATGAAIVLATSGPRGASVTTRDGLTVHAPIVRLPGAIVDTMGAGDATLASVVNSLGAAGVPDDDAGWRAILTEAMEVAAATCRSQGGLLQLHGDEKRDRLRG